MAIESMGRCAMPNAAAAVVQPSQQPQQAEQAQRKPVEPAQNICSVFSSRLRKRKSFLLRSLEAAVDRLNEMMKSSQRSLNFSVDKTSEQVVVQVRDLSTDKVVRQIPNEEALRFAESFDRMMGLIFNEEA